MNEQQQQQYDIQQHNNGVGFKSVAKYALLPGIIPLIKRLAGRFGEFMHMFTMIFGAVGLIDKNHPCLRPENAGRYRFIDILGLASHNVIFDRKHIPQIVMYFAVLLAIVLCISFVVVFMLNFGLSSSQAYAQFFSEPNSSVSTYDRSTDWAFMFLQETFGKTGIGNYIWTLNDEDIGQGSGSRFQAMFRAMLAHYSMALLIIAVFLVIYLMVVTLIESAVTGAPFGKRFNSVWAPIRLVIAIGLMVPVAAGYNSAQLIVFKMSDWGSNLATNVWIVGLSKMKEQKYLQPPVPDKGYRFIRALWTAEVCRYAWNKYTAEKGFTSWLLSGADYVVLAQRTGGVGAIYKFITEKGGAVTADQIIRDKDLIGNNLYISVEYGTRASPDFCGSFRIPIKQGDIFVNDLDGNKVPVNDFGKAISQKYEEIFNSLSKDIPAVAEAFVDKAGPGGSCDYMLVPETDCKHKEWIIDTYWSNLGFDKSLYKESCKTIGSPYEAKDKSEKNALFYKTNIAGTEAGDGTTPGYDWKTVINDTNKGLFAMIKSGTHGGWASAGAFYMTIAYVNGAMHGAVTNIPTVVTLPRVLVDASSVPQSPSWSDKIMNAFNPFSTNPVSGFFESDQKKEAARKTAKIVSDADDWFKNAPKTNNKYLRSWLGEEFEASLYLSKRNQADSDWGSDYRLRPLIHDAWFSIADGDVNPLGRLVSLGGRLMAIAAVMYAIGIAGSISLLAGSSALGSIFTMLGTFVGMAGIALALYLPMLPFIYFTFAVIEWVMGIVEAVIGMPLWALSMITIDGDGIGKTAQGNFMKLIGILLQPTILVISLIVSLILFSSAMGFFNKAFSLFTNSYMNTAGGGGDITSMAFLSGVGSSLVGFLSFTFLYAFAAYSIGQSCFKLIPKIGNTFMSWIGGPAPFSGDMDAGLAGYNKYLAMSQMKEFVGLGNNIGQARKEIRDKRNKKPEEKIPDDNGTQENNPVSHMGGSVTGGDSDGNSSQIPPLYKGDPDEFRNRGKTISTYDSIGDDGFNEDSNQNDHLPQASRWADGKIINSETGEVESKSRAEEVQDKQFAEFSARHSIDPNDKIAQAKFNKIMKKLGPNGSKDFLKRGHLDEFKDEDLL
jgi:conjugal transfer/type IV secretion protein DotA/TraY